MTTILKCATVLTALVCVGAVAVGNLTSIDYDAILSGNKPVLTVSDIVHTSSAKIDEAAKEVATESDVTSEEVAVEVDTASEEVVSEPEVTTAEFDEVGVDFQENWQNYQGVYEDYGATGDSYDNTAWSYDDSGGYVEDNTYVAPSYDEVEYVEDYTSESSYDNSGVINANADGSWISGSDFRFSGVHQDSSGYSYTYYSENVLPGGGLNIPGRHVGDEGYVRDGDGNLCVASSDLPQGTVVSVPFGSGTAVVYDSGCSSGVLDVYVSW